MTTLARPELDLISVSTGAGRTDGWLLWVLPACLGRPEHMTFLREFADARQIFITTIRFTPMLDRLLSGSRACFFPKISVSLVWGYPFAGAVASVTSEDGGV